MHILDKFAEKEILIADIFKLKCLKKETIEILQHYN